MYCEFFLGWYGVLCDFLILYILYSFFMILFLKFLFWLLCNWLGILILWNYLLIKCLVIVEVFWFFVGIVIVYFVNMFVRIKMFLNLFEVFFNRVKFIVKIFKGFFVNKLFSDGLMVGIGVLVIMYFLYFLIYFIIFVIIFG